MFSKANFFVFFLVIVLAQSAYVDFFGNEEEGLPVGTPIKNRVACHRHLLFFVVSVCGREHNCDREFSEIACSRVVSEEFLRSRCCPV